MPPDVQFQTGTTHGYDVFIWTCVDGEHVVVSQYSAEMRCDIANIERVPCGTRTKLEVALDGARHKPIRRW